MSCCGQEREADRAGVAVVGGADSSDGGKPLRLVPRERTTFYARGRATGRTYIFPPSRRGRLVDAADAPALLASGLFRVAR